MGLLTRFLLAQTSYEPFRVAWQRLKHEEHGHPFDKSVLLETKTFESHPQSDKFYVYTVHLRKCECGLCFLDNGLESRKRY